MLQEIFRGSIQTSRQVLAQKKVVIDMVIPCGDSEAQDAQVMGESTAIVLAKENWPQINLKAAGPIFRIRYQKKTRVVRRNGKKALHICQWRLLQTKVYGVLQMQ
jgi:hypothetical protein